MGKKVLIVTKYFVPHSNVDTNAVYDLITAMQKADQDLEIVVVTSASNYKTDIKLRDFDDNVLNRITIHQVRSKQASADSKIRKLLFGLIEGFRLIRSAQKMNIDHIITLSNPPLIVAWAVNMLKKSKLIYWSFDIYPDAFVADGLIVKSNPLYRLLEKWTYTHSPSAIMALGDQQFKYLSGKFNDTSIRNFILPCGIHSEPKTSNVPEWYKSDQINIAYVGNIGKAHSAEFLKNFLKTVENYTHVNFFMTIYGFHADDIRKYVEEKMIKNVKFVKSVSQSEMAYIDIHLISLNESWTHISVPSKAVTAICSGSALWFNGSVESDTWQMFKDSSFYSTSDPESIVETLESIDEESVEEKRKYSSEKALSLVKQETETINQLIDSFT